jgi:hypothetical protein
VKIYGLWNEQGAKSKPNTEDANENPILFSMPKEAQIDAED